LRVAIVGPGAIGSVYAAGLVEAGVDVTLIASNQQFADQLSSDGLVIIGPGGERTLAVAATADAATVGHVDLLLVLVKCYSTAAAMQAALPMLGPDTIVASLQNGWGNGDVLAAHVPPERLIVGLTYHGATVLSPGRVHHTIAGPTRLGPLDDRAMRAAERVGAMLADAGFEVEVRPDIRRQMWRKLALNTSDLAVASLTGLTAEGTANDPPYAVVEALARETLTLGNAMGFELDVDAEVADLRQILIDAGDGKASMLQDIERGRRTEVDVIYGAVVRLSKQLGVPTPINSVMYDLIRGFERAHGLS
jgi:2-dehydropantoate 2-reductase